MSSKRHMRDTGNDEEKTREIAQRYLFEFSFETERARCREAPARALIGFYERCVAKERSFREINTRRSE